VALVRRDKNGGAQVAHGLPTVHGLMTSDVYESLRAESATDDAQRAADARLKLRALAATQRDYLCETCSDTGEVNAQIPPGGSIVSVTCPDCDGTGGGGFSGSEA
jgi:hypothetical protein